MPETPMLARLRDPELLRALLVARHLSQAALARMAHCSRQLINYLVNGRHTLVRKSLAARISACLKVRVSFLFALPHITCEQQKGQSRDHAGGTSGRRPVGRSVPFTARHRQVGGATGRCPATRPGWAGGVR